MELKLTEHEMVELMLILKTHKPGDEREAATQATLLKRVSKLRDEFWDSRVRLGA
jgi:hypothetical protein